MTTTLHGDTRIDDYHWLREKGSAEVTNYLDAENTYADELLGPTKPLQSMLYSEMLGRIKEDDDSFPYRFGQWLYYSRMEAGKQYSIYCRKAAETASEQVVLDLNAMAEGHAFMSLGAYQVSPDGRLLAYSTDTTGFRQYTLRVKNLETGEHLSLRVEQAGTVAWSGGQRNALLHGR